MLLVADLDGDQVTDRKWFEKDRERPLTDRLIDVRDSVPEPLPLAMNEFVLDSSLAYIRTPAADEAHIADDPARVERLEEHARVSTNIQREGRAGIDILPHRRNSSAESVVAQVRGPKKRESAAYWPSNPRRRYRAREKVILKSQKSQPWHTCP